MHRIGRQSLRSRHRSEQTVLLAIRQLCAELSNRFAANDALALAGLTTEEIGTLRDLACALVLSKFEIMMPEAPYVGEFESGLLALLGDRQREPKKRISVPSPSAFDTAMLDEVANLLNNRKLRISFQSVVCGRGAAGHE